MDRGTLADELRRARLRTTQMRQGYDEREVDDFLDGVAARLRSDEPDWALAAAVAAARFTATTFRRGYDMADVDDSLQHVVETLRSPAAEGPDTSATPHASVAADASVELPSAVVEPQPGLVGRLARAVRGD